MPNTYQSRKPSFEDQVRDVYLQSLKPKTALHVNSAHKFTDKRQAAQSNINSTKKGWQSC
jgi:hypothetical protein